MGDGTRENPYTREDVLRLIEENGYTAEGLDLSGKTFEYGIDLRGLDLRGIILNEAVLKGAHLEGAVLSDARLDGTDLSGAHLEEVHLFNAHLEKASLRGAHLEKAILFNAHLEKAALTYANLEGTNLRDAHLEGTSLSYANYSCNTALELAEWGNYILGEEKNGLLDLAVATYRQLKMWYTNAGMNDVAAKFYYREKEADRKSLKWRSKSSFRHRLALQASYLVFGHGEDWKRILYWIAVVIFGLAAAYYFWGSFDTSSFWDTLYYSVASFTALGYGKWAPQPTGWAKGMGAAEAIIGVFMMALLLVTFVRKWTR